MHFAATFRDDLWSTELWRQAMIALILPEPGVYGQVRVVRQVAQALPLYGQQLCLSAPVAWTLAYEGATLWMSDTPQERLMMLQNTTEMTGHVLVAGGGLGLYAQYLRRYGCATRITIVERHPAVVAMLRTTLGGNRAIDIVHEPFEAFIAQPHRQRFDSCFIDIHPTLDPRWLPGLTLAARPVSGHCYRAATHLGLPMDGAGTGLWFGAEQLPLLSQQRCFDDDLGHNLVRTLPAGWAGWSAAGLQTWLVAYATQVAWPQPTLPLVIHSQ